MNNSSLLKNKYRIKNGIARIETEHGDATMTEEHLLVLVRAGVEDIYLGKHFKTPILKGRKSDGSTIGIRHVLNPKAKWPRSPLECIPLPEENKPIHRKIRIDADAPQTVKDLLSSAHLKYEGGGRPPVAVVNTAKGPRRLHNVVAGGYCVPLDGDFLNCRKDNLVLATKIGTEMELPTGDRLLIDEPDAELFRLMFADGGYFAEVGGDINFWRNGEWRSLADGLFALILGREVKRPERDPLTGEWDYRRGAL